MTFYTDVFKSIKFNLWVPTIPKVVKKHSRKLVGNVIAVTTISTHTYFP